MKIIKILALVFVLQCMVLVNGFSQEDSGEKGSGLTDANIAAFVDAVAEKLKNEIGQPQDVDALAAAVVEKLKGEIGQPQVNVDAIASAVAEKIRSETVQSRTEEAQRGSLRPFTGNDFTLGNDNIKELHYYLSSDLSLSRRPNETKQVVNGRLVTDTGDIIEYLTIQNSVAGNYKNLSEDKEILIIIFKVRDKDIELCFKKDQQDNMFYFEGAVDVKYYIDGRRPYLCIRHESKGSLDNRNTPPIRQQNTGNTTALNRDNSRDNSRDTSMDTSRIPSGGRSAAQPGSVSIMGTGTFDENVIVNYIMSMSANSRTRPTRDLVQRIVKAYKQEAELEGVNYDIAIAQMCYATQNLTNREIRETTFNFAGLDTSQGINTNHRNPNKHDNWPNGVKAHIEHLKGYASTIPPSTPIVNRRYQYLKDNGYLGTVQTLDALFGIWAPLNPEYGDSIRRIMNDISRLQNQSVARL
jgi:hypothetical protein